MRDHMQAILQNVNKALKECKYDDTLGTILEGIRVNSQVLLSADHHVVPSKLFGNIDIPKGVISDMSNGDDDLWFKVGKQLHINVFYENAAWMFGIYPVNNLIALPDHIESGKL
tara:strand:+ start:248 stop:589 length:342 start_codon:yes stop_codon:yes gene_type:complete